MRQISPLEISGAGGILARLAAILAATISSPIYSAIFPLAAITVYYYYYYCYYYN